MDRYSILFILYLTLMIAACMPAASSLIKVVPPTSTLTSIPTKAAPCITPIVVATESPQPTITPSPTISKNRTEVSYYVVQVDDTLSGIAKRYNLSPESILFLNSLVSPGALVTGTTLVIPPMDSFYYTWEEGESLPKVDHRFDVSILSIVNWQENEIDGQIEQIQPGTSLFIPSGKIPYKEWSVPVLTTTLTPP